MLFFNRKKKERKQELDAAFQRVIDEINDIDDRDNPRKIEHYILDSCEHIISTAKELDASKLSYIQLSEYLSDVDKIESMDPETKAIFKDLADNVYSLTKKKIDYRESDKRMSDEEFMMLSEREDQIVSDIKRMEENERYQQRISEDIKFLEAEKGHWDIERDYSKDQMKKLRIASLAVFVAVIGLVIAWLVVPGISSEVRFPMLLAGFVGVSGAFFLFLYMGIKRKSYRKITAKLNQNINLLNVARMRYVNISKALAYENSIYDVKSAAELTYLWEQYMLAAKEMEANRRNNIDLTYYLEKLYKLIKNLDLNYEKKWVSQVGIMIDPEKLGNLRSKLSAKRDILKSQIESNTTSIRIERDEIDRLMKEHNFFVPEVMEIINSVDRITGRAEREVRDES